MSTLILGISAYYHDSAAALIRDGTIVAAAQQERFSRRKHDPGFPAAAIRYCLQEAGATLADVGHVVFYDKPLLKFERLLETYLAFAPRGMHSFVTAMPVWLKEKLYLKATLKKELAALGGVKEKLLPPLLFTEHHQAHAASAFFASPFKEAAVLCLDGVGEWATTSVWHGLGNSLTPKWEMDFPHSLGLLYSAFTYYAGFRVNSGEYKVMGLAPYGEPRYVDTILGNLVDVKEDGTFRLNMDYFDYAAGLRMTNAKFDTLFGGPPRRPDGPLTQRDMDIARSVQAVTEDIVLRLARTVHAEQGADCLCLAGGVALNCVANGRLVREGPFRDLWVQPAAGDAGGAIGAALSVWHEYLGNSREAHGEDIMQGAYLGPRAGRREIAGYLDSVGAPYRRLGEDGLLAEVAEVLGEGKVVGWYQGRMEFGPRALGARSILGDPRSPQMQSVMNLKIKHRESFRPFAPAVKEDRASEWFELDRPSPYMTLAVPVAESRRIAETAAQAAATGIERLGVLRSEIPAATHVDGSARVQTVRPETHPRFYALLDAFERRTGCPVLLNTSFNVRGEPIVCTPEDAYRCFMRTDMDYLVLEDCLLAKPEQPPREEADAQRQAPETERAALYQGLPTEAERRELRRFGLTMAVVVPVLFGLLLPWLLGREYRLWPWLVAGVFAGSALLLPVGLRTSRRIWMVLGRVLGRLNSRILLGAAFWVLVVPTGLVMRIMGRDPMSRRIDTAAASYRTPSRGRGPGHMERPF